MASASQKWNQTHKAQCAAAQKRYEEKHRDKVLQAKREWWRAHKGRFGSWEQYVHYARLTGGMLQPARPGEHYKRRTNKYRQAHGQQPIEPPG